MYSYQALGIHRKLFTVGCMVLLELWLSDLALATPAPPTWLQRAVAAGGGAVGRAANSGADSAAEHRTWAGAAG
jgi:hypothetical protein